MKYLLAVIGGWAAVAALAAEVRAEHGHHLAHAPAVRVHVGYLGGYGHPWAYGYPAGCYSPAWYGGYHVPHAYPYWYPPPYYGPYVLPPVVIPADTLYGPRPIQQLMGVEQWFAPRAAAAAAPRVVVPAPAAPAEPAAPRPPAARDAPPAAKPPHNEATVNLAWRFIGFGDAHFAAQRYVDANDRYRKATQTAPQLAAGHFRQSFALAALGRYDLAVAAVKRGLELDPAWPQSDFRLAELYDGNQMAKTAHLDQLAKAAEDKPLEADLLFLVGVHLWFDGQQARAKPFFRRAAQLAAADRPHIEAFLKE